jgi:hypothetical protein
MKKNLVLYTSLFVSMTAQGSPTTNEFLPCKKKAVAIQEHCLLKDNNRCGEKSKSSFDACQKRVINNHSKHFPSDKNEQLSKLNRIEKNGDCVYINAHNDYLCLVIEDTLEGWVSSKLVIKSSNKTIVDTETYLNAMHVEVSPNSKVLMVAVSAEGHPSFGFYDTDRMFNGKAKLEADVYLDEYYFDHFEYMRDDGDVVFSLSEQSGQSCHDLESNSAQVHSSACLVGFNIFTKQTLTFDKDRPCALNK